MRVLHFFKTYWPDTFGGVERTIHALAKGGNRHGITSDILALSPSPSSTPLSFDGHTIHQVACDLELASTGFSREAFAQFRTLSRSADVIHYHYPWPFMDLVDLVTRHNKPTIVTYHSDIVKQKVFLQLYKPLMHRFLKHTDSIVATSPNYLASSPVLQAYRAKTTVIPLGLDQDDYPAPSTEKLSHWHSRFPQGFFLFTGVLRYYKGIHILFEAARKTRLPVVILGGNGIEADLQAMKSKEQMDQFHLLGPLPDEDKIALLTLCRALVFPSHLRSEAFGLSLVEAAMHRKPMISCEIGTGTSYVNLNGETGLTIPPADPDALANALQTLWQDETLCQRYGMKAYQRFDEMFRADTMVQSYAALYKRLSGAGV